MGCWLVPPRGRTLANPGHSPLVKGTLQRGCVLRYGRWSARGASGMGIGRGLGADIRGCRCCLVTGGGEGQERRTHAYGLASLKPDGFYDKAWICWCRAGGALERWAPRHWQSAACPK